MSETDKRPPGWERRLVELSMLASAPTVLALGARWWWPLELMSHFRLQYAVALALALGLLLWRKRWKIALVVGACLLWNGALLLPLYLPPPTASVATKGPKYRALLANLNSSNREYSRLLRYVGQTKPDILALLEISDGWKRALQPLRKAYPYGKIVPRRGNFGIALLSRHRLKGLAMTSFGPNWEPSLLAQVRLGARELHLVVTHPFPPIGGALARARNAHVKRLSAHVASHEGPWLVMGDLNMTPWSPHFRDLLERAKLHDARKGFGIQRTWLLHLWPLSIPVDHALHSPQLAIRDFRVGPDLNSDHWPVLLDFSFP